VLEASIFYLLLAAWARPRDGQALLLPGLACLTLLVAMALRALLDSTTVAEWTCLLATTLAAMAWAFVVARACAAPAYWQDPEAPRALLVLGAVFGGGEASGFQALAFWASLLLWCRGHALLI